MTNAESVKHDEYKGVFRHVFVKVSVTLMTNTDSVKHDEYRGVFLRVFIKVA